MSNMGISKWQNRLIYGLTAGGVLLVYKTLLIILSNETAINSSLGFLETLFIVSLITVCINKSVARYRDENLDGYISYSQSFKHSFFVCFISFLMKDLPAWVYNSFISDTFKSEYVNMTYEIMYETYGSEIADSAQTLIEHFVSAPSLFLSLVISTTIISLIISAITAIFNKKEQVF